MYKWKIGLILKSGKELTVYHEGNENNSADVARKILVGDMNSMNGFNNKSNTENIYVRLGEIASASISEA